MIPSLTGSLAQWDEDVGSLFEAAGVTGAGVLPGPAAPVTSAAPVACSSASVPAAGVKTPADAASATALPGRHRALGSPPAQRGARLVGRGLVRVGNVARVSPLPLLALPFR